MWNRKRETGARLTSRSAGTSSTIEPVPGHSAIRPTTSSVASRNSLPSPDRCSSNQTAATCSSSSASAENSMGSVTERAWRGLAHVPRATVVPDPRRTMHVVRVARVPSPTQHGQRRGRRARPDRGSRGGQRRTRRGDPLEGPAHHAGVCRDRRSRPTGYSRCEATGWARHRSCDAPCSPSSTKRSTPATVPGGSGAAHIATQLGLIRTPRPAGESFSFGVRPTEGVAAEGPAPGLDGPALLVLPSGVASSLQNPRPMPRSMVGRST